MMVARTRIVVLAAVHVLLLLCASPVSSWGDDETPVLTHDIKIMSLHEDKGQWATDDVDPLFATMEADDIDQTSGGPGDDEGNIKSPVRASSSSDSASAVQMAQRLVQASPKACGGAGMATLSAAPTAPCFSVVSSKDDIKRILFSTFAQVVISIDSAALFDATLSGIERDMRPVIGAIEALVHDLGPVIFFNVAVGTSDADPSSFASSGKATAGERLYRDHVLRAFKEFGVPAVFFHDKEQKIKKTDIDLRGEVWVVLRRRELIANVSPVGSEQLESCSSPLASLVVFDRAGASVPTIIACGKENFEDASKLKDKMAKLLYHLRKSPGSPFKKQREDDEEAIDDILAAQSAM